MPDYDNTPPEVIAPAGFTPDNTAPGAKAHAYAPDNTAPGVKAPGFVPDASEPDAIEHAFAPDNTAATAKAHAYAPDNTAPGVKAHAYAPDNTAPGAKAHNLTPANAAANPIGEPAASLPAMPSIFTPAFTTIEQLQARTASVADAAAGRIIQGTINGELKAYQVRALGEGAEDIPAIVLPSNHDAENNNVAFFQAGL